MVPGQVAFDNARSALANGNPGQAAVQGAASVAEIGATVATAGLGEMAEIVVTAKRTASAGEAAAAETPASTPVGRGGSPMNVPRGTNTPGTVNGQQYTGHAFDQMQGRGITPSVVESTIQTGVKSAGRDGATIYTTPEARVIVNPDGSIKTVMPQ